MTAKLSNLVDKTSGASLQVDGHVEVPTQSAKDLRELEEEDSSLPTHCLGLQPRGHLSGHPNMKYCLEICMTLTEELGAIPPPSHSWMAPLVEDMLHETRTRLTKAVVTGPCRVHFFLWETFNGGGLNGRQG